MISHWCSYKVRKKQLAAIDWNYYVNNAAATTKAGDVIMCKKKKKAQEMEL